MLSQTPRLPRICILLLLLLLQQGKTDQLALYQAVDKFSTGSNATLIVRGDTVSGCKLVLLDKERGKTCCYSAPERRDTLCDPSIQSESCREKVKVVEEPGFCNITLPNIVKEDAGPYLVIFPGKVNDNQELEVQVVEKSYKGLFLPAASAISRYEEVRGDFVPGTTGTISILGNTNSGCKILLVEMSRNLTCCFSKASRGETLCHPDTQSTACRKKDMYRVDELPGACLLNLPNIDHNDAGPYKAIFPARLRDNIKFNVNVRIVPAGHSDIIWVSGGISSIIVVILCFGVGFFCYSKRFPCHPKFIAERSNAGYEMNSVGDLSIQSLDQKNANNQSCGKKSSDNHCFANESYSEIG